MLIEWNITDRYRLLRQVLEWRQIECGKSAGYDDTGIKV
jgi:hypothetical protein